MKVLGAGISAVVFFLPLGLQYDGQTLTVDAHLTAPITADTEELILHGFEFRIDYYCSVIVNDRRAYSSHVENSLTHASADAVEGGEAPADAWLLNGVVIPAGETQRRMGTAQFMLAGVQVDPGDEALVFVKAVILPDSTFRQSTGLSTRVLWNHYVPRVKEKWVYRDGAWERR